MLQRIRDSLIAVVAVIKFVFLTWGSQLHWMVKSGDTGSRFTFPGGKRAAYVSTWDDTVNLPSVQKVCEVFAQAGLEGVPVTLFCDTDLLTPATVAALPTNVVVGSHTRTHPWGGFVSISDRELRGSQAKIQRLLGSNHGRTFCFPHGQFPVTHLGDATNKTIEDTYLGARTTQKGFVDSKDGPYRVRCLKIETIESPNIHTWLQGGRAMVTYGHGIRGIGGWNPVGLSKFKAHVQEIARHKDNIWFTSFSGLVTYLKDTNQFHNNHNHNNHH